MTDKKQLAKSKKDFIQSLKQLRHFFNNLKDVHSQFDMTSIRLKEIEESARLQDALKAEVLNQEQILQSPEALRFKDQRLDKVAEFQSQQKNKLASLMNDLESIQVTDEDLNVKLNPDTKYFSQATEAIKQAEKFSQLIQIQENETLNQQIMKKQSVVDICDAENRDLQQQLDKLLQQIEDKKNQERQIREEIKQEELRTQDVLLKREQMIEGCQIKIKEARAQYNQKIKATHQGQDLIQHQKSQLQAQLSYLKQKNELMEFYPQKVNQLEESLARKNEELELYQEVIDRCYYFVTERIQENEKKQLLISELNQYVGSAIQRILDDEKAFYESDTRDRLKVPPYNYVKRQPRDYTKENQLFSQFINKAGNQEANIQNQLFEVPSSNDELSSDDNRVNIDI